MTDAFAELLKLLGNPAQRNEAILNYCIQLENMYHFAAPDDTKELYIYNPKKDIIEKKGEPTIEKTLQQYCPSIPNAVVESIIEKMKQRNLIERGSIDSDPAFLHVGNGWLNIKNREFSPPTPDRLSFAKLGISYDPKAENPAQRAFFEDIFEEDDLPIVQKFFGYLLLPDQRYKKAFILVGKKDTGKSKFLELVEKFAGSVSHVSLHDMAANNHNVAGITRSIVNTTSELPKYKLKDVSLFKSITGGDERTFRDIFERPFNAQVRAKFVMASNDLPDFDGMDRTFIDRWIVFRCTNVFVKGEDMDPEIISKITTDNEMSGLLNYALAGLENLITDGYFKDEDYTELQSKWQAITSKIAEYRDKYLQFENTATIPTVELYNHYKTTIAPPLQPMGDKMFGRELKKLGILKDRETTGKRLYFYKGVRLKDEYRSAAPDDGQTELPV